MLNVRFATQNDVLEMQELLIKAWQITYKKLYSEDYITRVINEFYNKKRLEKEILTRNKDFNGYMIAEKEGKVLGCICGASEDMTGLIYVLYVHPDFKQKGIGSELLRTYTTHQKDTYHITKQKVSVVENNQMAIPFYEKMGFTLVEVVPNWFDPTKGNQCHYERFV